MPHTPGSSSRLHIQALHRFHGLHPEFAGSALPVAARRRASNDAADFALCYGPLSRSHLTWLSTLRFDAGRFPPDAGSLLPGLLAATRTGLTPAGDDELDAVSSPHGSPPARWAHVGSGAGAVRIVVDGRRLAYGRPVSRQASSFTRRGRGASVSSARHLEPCMRFSRTRLTDVFHRRHSASPARAGGAWGRQRSHQG